MIDFIKIKYKEVLATKLNFKSYVINYDAKPYNNFC